MNISSFLSYVAILISIFATVKSLYNDRYGSDRYSRSQYMTDDGQPVMLAEDPNSAAFFPMHYQRVASPYDLYRPRQRMRYYDDRPYKRSSDYYQKRSYDLVGYDGVRRKQCPALNRRRSIAYSARPYKLVPLKEDIFLEPELNSQQRVERTERDDGGGSYLYSLDRRDDERDETPNNEEASAKFIDDKYPAVLANFKIGTKLDKKSLTEGASKIKRESRQNDSAVAPREMPAIKADTSVEDIETDEKVAEELRDILDYMGLIDEDNQPGAKREEEKRESKDEDEDMEEGNNKISLVREQQKSTEKERSKREEREESKESSSTPSQCVDAASVTEHARIQKRSDADKTDDDKDSKDSKREEEPRLQDDNSTSVGSPRASELTKLAETIPSLSEERDSNDYEKRVERQIQSKINALKEEVKREIAELKAQEAAQAVHSLNNDDSQRKKRQAVNTLLDEENPDLNPALHPDGDLKPHVRKRRYLEGNDREAVLTTPPSPQHRDPSTHRPSPESASDLSATSARNNDTVALLENSFPKSDGNFKRRRRKRAAKYEISYIPARLKRENRIMPGATLAFVPYRDEDDLMETENGELIDSGYYDFVPTVKRKREVPFGALSSDANFDIQRRSVKREAYEDDGEKAPRGPSQADRSERCSRQKRQNYERYEDLSAFHSGGGAVSHLSAIRARSMSPKGRLKRRLFDKRYTKSIQQPQQLSDMSDTDLFGALPQGFAGELNRFKRVKRNEDKG